MVWSSLLQIRGDLLKSACWMMYLPFASLHKVSMITNWGHLVDFSALLFVLFSGCSQLLCLQFLSLALMPYWSQWKSMKFMNPCARRKLLSRLCYLIRLKTKLIFFTIFKIIQPQGTSEWDGFGKETGHHRAKFLKFICWNNHFENIMTSYRRIEV